jgi:hypothetical protein
MPSAHSREREDELKDCMKELAERIRRDIRAPVQSEREASLFPVEKSELYAAHDLVAFACRFFDSRSFNLDQTPPIRSDSTWHPELAGRSGNRIEQVYFPLSGTFLGPSA